MNREDIIHMAREAKFFTEEWGDGLHHVCVYNFQGSETEITEELQRFATLVASAERERIKQANAPEIERINAHIKELEDAVLAEREACAKVCEDWMEIFPDFDKYCKGGIDGLTKASASIRARGQA